MFVAIEAEESAHRSFFCFRAFRLVSLVSENGHPPLFWVTVGIIRVFFPHPFYVFLFLSGLMLKSQGFLPGGCQATASSSTQTDLRKGPFFFCRAWPKQQNAAVGPRLISRSAWCPLRSCAKTNRNDVFAREFLSGVISIKFRDNQAMVNLVRGFVFDQIWTPETYVQESMPFDFCFAIGKYAVSL
jgi:hypothetical protein